MTRSVIGEANIDIARKKIQWANNQTIVYDKFNRYDKLHIVKSYVL